MLLVGLTGGIGAGKTTVADLLAARGAIVMDADRIAREVVAPGTPALRRIVERFGPEVLAPDGSLDRARLAETAFRDDDARAALNGITHPEVMRVIAERLEGYVGTDAIVVLDVPLLVEIGGGGADLLVVVGAGEEARVERLARARAMSPADVRARMAAQASDAEREALADVLIRNDGTEEELAAQVDALWARLVEAREKRR